MSDQDHKPLDEWADERAEARFRENQQIQRKLRAARSAAREAEGELADVRNRLRVYEDIATVELAPPEWLQPPQAAGDKHKAIPSLVITDIHWGERVDPAEVEELNAYDTTIAEKRIKRATTGCIKLCRDYLSGVEYDGINVMLGGDLLSGTIHQELRETNIETPTESVVRVMEALVAGIRQLADHFGKVHAAAVVGNHGRTTKRARSKKRAADNYDGLVYRLIAHELRDDDRITMQVATGADAYFSVYNTRYCLTHGDQFRGGSGISGALSPLMLGLHRKRRRDQKAGNPWDVLVMGHWHQSYYLKDLIVSGAVVGYNEYAYTSNLPPEEASAAMWLTTPERGISTYMPVHLQRREQEGW